MKARELAEEAFRASALGYLVPGGLRPSERVAHPRFGEGVTEVGPGGWLRVRYSDLLTSDIGSLTRHKESVR